MILFLILISLVLVAATIGLVLLQDASDRAPAEPWIIPGTLDDEAGAS